MHIYRKLILATALAAFGASSMAAPRGAANRINNFTFATATAFIPLNDAGALLLVVNVPAAGNYVLTYSAECAVNAAAGNSGAWVDIDIIINGTVRRPTQGSADAFCAANGTAGFDGWVRASITTQVTLVAGGNTVQIQGRLNAGATGGWFGDTAFIIHD